MELEEELSARITDALTMFQSNLGGRRKIAVKSMSESRRTFDTCCIADCILATSFPGLPRVSQQKLYQPRKHNFPEKSKLPKFIVPVKISSLVFLCFPGWKWKISSQANLFVSRLPCSIPPTQLRLARLRSYPNAPESAHRLTCEWIVWVRQRRIFFIPHSLSLITSLNPIHRKTLFL